MNPICLSLKSWGIFLTVMFYSCLAQAQSPDATDLFRQAHEYAYQQHDYPGAISKCRAALALTPNDPDIAIFMGRLFAWTHQFDSARKEFEQVLTTHPGYEDASIAYTDLAIWNDSTLLALSVCEAGLRLHPHSEGLQQRHASLLADLHRWKDARHAVDSLLVLYPQNTAGRALLARIKDYTASNKIGISYTYTRFDRQFNDPWHLVSIDYSHQTPVGVVIGRMNYANRFRTSGVQFEAEAYPHISRVFYGYLNFGYSADETIYPRYRAGASLYANLPHAFEADGGVRLLYFGSNTWLYTLALGKYYKSFWFNARTYLVPGDQGISQSVTLTSRYYTGGPDDYISLAAGTGLSPDDRSNNQQLAYARNLKTYKAAAGWRRSFGKLNIFSADVQWLYQEYLARTYGNQVEISIGYQRRFK